MSRRTRTAVLAVAAALPLGLAAPAAAASAPPPTLGPILVTPASGGDETLFNGKVAAECPVGTVDGLFAAVGPGSDFLTNGEGSLGLADETSFQGGDLTWFLYASVANLRTATPASFQASGTYTLTLYCMVEGSDGVAYPAAVYATDIDYQAGTESASGTWTVVTPGAAIVGEEFFSPDVLQSLDREAGGVAETEGDPGAAAAQGGAAAAPQAPAPEGSVGSEAAPSAAEAASAPPADDAAATAQDGAAVDAADAGAEENADNTGGAGRIVVLVALALAVTAAGVWLVLRRRRDNARIDALGQQSPSTEDSPALVHAAGAERAASEPGPAGS